MKNVFLLPCFFLLLTQWLIHPTTMQAQGWVRLITPTAVYGDVVGATAHPDGGVVVLYAIDTVVKMVHYSSSGALVWQQTVLPSGAAKDIAVGSDGLPTVLAYNKPLDKIVLSHFDWQGNALGSHVVDEYKSSTSWTHLAPFPGGGFVANLRYRNSPSIPPTRAALHRFDAGDSLLWRSTIDTLPASAPLMENTGLGVNAQGQSIVGTNIGFSTNTKHHLTVFDAQGDSLWRRSDLNPTTVGVLADGNFFYVQQNSPLAGQSGPADIVLRKISPAGDLIWETPCDPYTIFITRGKYLATPDGVWFCVAPASVPWGNPFSFRFLIIRAIW